MLKPYDKTNGIKAGERVYFRQPCIPATVMAVARDGRLFCRWGDVSRWGDISIDRDGYASRKHTGRTKNVFGWVLPENVDRDERIPHHELKCVQTHRKEWSQE